MEPTRRPLHLVTASVTAGTNPSPGPPDHQDDEGQQVARGDLVRIGFVAVAVVVSWFLPWQPFAKVNIVAPVATLVGGYPVFKEAFEALRERRMTMELSMTIALVAALTIREAFTALVIVLVVLIAEVLEHMTVGRGRRAIKDLLSLLPRTGAVRRAAIHPRVVGASLHSELDAVAAVAEPVRSNAAAVVTLQR